MAKDDLKSQFTIAHGFLGREVFKAPMSYDARELLGTILLALNKHIRPGGNKNLLIEEFAKQYSACLYEDAILGWPFRDVQKRVSSTISKAKTSEQILEVARLIPLFNRTWDVPVSADGAFRISRSVSQSEVYDYLTQDFLLDDFSRTDLKKLSDIAKKPLDTIKDICKKLDRPEQKFIAYLYRVVTNEEKQAEVISQTNERMMQASNAKLKDILAAVADTPRFRPQVWDKSWIEDVKVTRIMEGTDDIKNSVGGESS
jgi:hypothetical protein